MQSGYVAQKLDNIVFSLVVNIYYPNLFFTNFIKDQIMGNINIVKLAVDSIHFPKGNTKMVLFFKKLKAMVDF